jgi:hypothetical protein
MPGSPSTCGEKLIPNEVSVLAVTLTTQSESTAQVHKSAVALSLIPFSQARHSVSFILNLQLLEKYSIEIFSTRSSVMGGDYNATRKKIR